MKREWEEGMDCDWIEWPGSLAPALEFGHMSRPEARTTTWWCRRPRLPPSGLKGRYCGWDACAPKAISKTWASCRFQADAKTLFRVVV